jgi:hypothetical protein
MGKILIYDQKVDKRMNFEGLRNLVEDTIDYEYIIDLTKNARQFSI